MSDTYSQIYMQCVFSVSNRDCILLPEWRKDIFEYIAGIVRMKGQKSIIVGGYYDHIHLFVGIKPDMPVSDLIRDVKASSSSYINKNRYIRRPFSWQKGYGVFSYSRSQVNSVYNYILGQEEHHRKRTFREEYLEFLKKFEVEYNEKYLFDWIDLGNK